VTRGRAAAAAAVVVAAALIAGACSQSEFVPIRVVQGGSASVGEDLIARLGCGSCHEIPGIKEADGLVGPPLAKFGRRQVIAGQLANTPENLMRWLMDPKGVEPGTDMPNLGITPEQARDIATYLEQLG
jgi:cytochrome c